MVTFFVFRTIFLSARSIARSLASTRLPLLIFPVEKVEFSAVDESDSNDLILLLNLEELEGYRFLKNLMSLHSILPQPLILYAAYDERKNKTHGKR